MTDLLDALPEFDVKPYSHLIHSLEKNEILVSDLLTLDPIEIARRCTLPPSQVRLLTRDVIEACQDDLGIRQVRPTTAGDNQLKIQGRGTLGVAVAEHILPTTSEILKTQDANIDEALGGGIRTGYITELVGESAAGKTQLVMSLLLSVQLPLPLGLSRAAIYISTEAPLNTMRLRQMLFSHPAFTSLVPESRPSLSHVHAIPVNDLEIQDHIIEFQLPVAIERYNIGLVVIDSVAANYRAEHGSSLPEDLADRATDLAQLGKLLRKVATDYNVAVVCTNQVSDRFDDPALRVVDEASLHHPIPPVALRTSSSPAHPPFPLSILPNAFPASAPSPAPAEQTVLEPSVHHDELLSLDHQLRFFSGWGDDPAGRANYSNLKTPALGLVWANQISARIVMKIEGDHIYEKPVQALGKRKLDEYTNTESELGGNIWSERKRRRWLGVVFAPWVHPALDLVEYEIKTEGIVSVQKIDKESSDRNKDDLESDLEGGVDDEDFSAMEAAASSDKEDLTATTSEVLQANALNGKTRPMDGVVKLDFETDTDDEFP